MESFSNESDFFGVKENSVRPYQFKPTYEKHSSGSDSEELTDFQSETESADETVDVSQWCTCRRCTAMPTAHECRCCKTMNVVDQKADGFQCVTDHDGFQVNCLNICVLETSYYEYRGHLEEGQITQIPGIQTIHQMDL